MDLKQKLKQKRDDIEAKSKKQRDVPGRQGELIKDVQRYPRPLGVTMALHQYHSLIHYPQKTKIQGQLTPDNILQRTKELILQNWIINKGYLNNHLHSIEDISLLLQISPTLILRHMSRYNEKMAGMQGLGNDVGQLARELTFWAAKKGLEIQALAHHQYDALQASQGAEYKPFISREVNASIANLVSAQKPILDLIKITSPTTPNLPNVPGDTHNHLYMTTDMATKMIREKGPSLIEDQAALDAKKDTLFLTNPEIPNINARAQDLSEIGLSGNPKRAKQGKLDHENRRQRLEGIVEIEDADGLA